MHQSKQNRQRSNSSRDSARRKRQLAAAVMGVAVVGCASWSSAVTTTYTWDPAGTGNSGGTNNWDTTSTFWDTTAGTGKLWGNTTSSLALFGGNMGTVTLNGSVQAIGLQFNTTGYTISGTGNLSLAGSGIAAGTLTSGNTTISVPVAISAAQTWNVGAGSTLVVGGNLSTAGNGTYGNNSWNLSISSAGGPTGNVTLTGANNVIEGFQLFNGTLDLTGNLTTNGTYDYLANGNLTSAVATLIVENGATFTELNASNNMQIGKGGNGTVIQKAGSTVNFNPENAGHTSGDLVVGISSGAGNYTMYGGTLNMNGGTSRLVVGESGATSVVNVYAGANIISAGTIIFQGASGTLNQAGGNVSLSGTTEVTFASGTNTYILGNGTFGSGTLVAPGFTATGGTNTFEFNGGTLQASAGNATFMTGLTTGNITANSIIDNGGYAITIGQPLLGSGGLTFQNTGTTTLTGSNSYAGATTITGGNLTVSGTGSINSSSGITINGSGATFVKSSSVNSTPAISLMQGTLNGTGTVGNVTVSSLAANTVTNAIGGTAVLTIPTLAFSGNGTLSINVAGGNVTTPGIATTTLTTANAGSGEITVNVTPTSAWTTPGNTTYDLLSFSNVTGNVSDFTKGSIGLLTSRESATLGLTGSDLTLTIASDSPKWTGLDNGNWMVGSTGPNHNWQLINAGTPTDYIQGDTVLFDDSASSAVSPGNVSISSGNVTPTATTFNNSVINYTLSSSGGYSISGNGSLTKNGTGSLTIQTADTYAGGTIVNGGTMTIGTGGSLGASTGTLAVNNPNTGAGTAVLLNLSTSSPTTTGSLSGTLAIPSSGTNTATIDNGGQLFTVNQTTPGTFAGTITDSGGFAMGSLSTSTLTLSGQNTYTGPTTISAGTLQAGVASVPGVSGAFGTESAVTLGNVSGATLALNNFNTEIGSLSGGGTVGGKVTLGNATLTDVQTTATSFAGVISGTGGLTMNGSGGNLTLSALNTYTGPTTISAGTLSAGVASSGSGGAFGNLSAVTLASAGGANLALNGFNTTIGSLSGGGTAGGNVTLGSGGLTVGGLNTSTSFGGAITGTGNAATNGQLIKVGSGNLTLSSTANSVSGMQVNGGTLDITGNLALSGTYNYIATGSTTGTLVIDNNAAITLTGNTTNNFVVGRNNGNGTVIQNAGSTFNFDPTGGNTLLIIGAGSITTTGVYNMNGGTLNMNGLTLEVGIGNATGMLNVYAGANITSVGTFLMGGTGGNATVNQAGGNITMSGTNNLLIGGASTDTDVYNLGNGTLGSGTLTVAGVATGNSSASSTFNFNGGTLQASGNNTNFMAGLTTGNVTANSAINNAGYAVTIGQKLIGSGGLTFQGAGTTTITASNSYSGGTTISGGTLLANNGPNNGSATGSGAVTINNGGTLGGNGTIGNGDNALAVNSGGTIAAGASLTTVGTLTTGNQTWSTGGNYAWKITGSAGNSSVAIGSGGSGKIGGGSGTEGSDWDNLVMSALTVSSTTGSPFTIVVSGTPSGSTNSTYSWVIAQTGSTSLPSGITDSGNLLPGGNSTQAGEFTLNTANFTFDGVTNPYASTPSAFSLEFEPIGGQGSGDYDLVLDYYAAPEPGTGLLVLAGGLPMLLSRRRRNGRRLEGNPR
jgi:autotransporter-associated beta strand protein